MGITTAKKNVADETEQSCDGDKFPPRYLLANDSSEILNAGRLGGQLIRYVKATENLGAGSMLGVSASLPHRRHDRSTVLGQVEFWARLYERVGHLQ